jgi:hypothetical protein
MGTPTVYFRRYTVVHAFRRDYLLMFAPLGVGNTATEAGLMLSSLLG